MRIFKILVVSLMASLLLYMIYESEKSLAEWRGELGEYSIAVANYKARVYKGCIAFDKKWFKR